MDQCSDGLIEQAFDLIRDPEAAAFFRVVAATGCRPGEVALFDWSRWILEGRGRGLHGYSPKVEKEFVAICNPLKWMKGLDPALLVVGGGAALQSPLTPEMREFLVRHYSRLLKLVQRDLKAAGWQHIPTWTDLRHLWTIRAEIDGINLRTAAIAQAHSPRMAEMVYLRHGEKRQVLAEIERIASVTPVAS